MFIITAAYFMAFYLKFDFYIPAPYLTFMFKTLVTVLIIKTGVFYYSGLFVGLWRYVNLKDLWPIIKANISAELVCALGVFFLSGFKFFIVSIFILDWLICVFLISGVRIVSRMLRERFRFANSRVGKKVLIVGAGEAGILVLNEYWRNLAIGKVAAFVDDDKDKWGRSINGVKILGGRKKIGEIVKNLGIEEIVLAIPSAKGQVIRELIACCQVPNVSLKIVPGLVKILSGELEIGLREVRPEDLLGRETVSINEFETSQYLKNKRILITGAAGSIGSELCRQIVSFGPAEIILIDRNENNLYFLIIELKARFKHLNLRPIIGDINDIGMLKNVFCETKPHVVFHAAAYKHVPLMEDNPIAAVKNNVLGSRNMIYAAHHYKVERFVLISTDKAVNPINTMGLTKRLSEMFLQAKAKRSKTKFMAVRFGNVLGSDGSVVPLFKKQIEAGGPITITHPATTRYFMSIKEAVLLVLQAGAIGLGGEIFILDMGEQIKIMDLAKNLVALSGLELGKDILIEYVGLRPGEKIKEELLLDKEKDKVTKHDKIYISQGENFDAILLRKQMKELAEYTDWSDKEKVIKKMKEIIGSSHANK